MTQVRTTIAVVDDHNIFRSMVVSALTGNLPSKILSFDDPVRVLGTLKSGEGADIILSDINMPQMNGMELLKRIKKEYPGKVCIMMSAEPGYEDFAKQSGADAFLAKPFKLADLLTVVEKFIGRLENRPPAFAAQPI